MCWGREWGLVCVEAWGRAWCVLKEKWVVRGGAGLVCVEGEGGVLPRQTVFTSSVCSRLTVGSEISSLAGRAQAFSLTPFLPQFYSDSGLEGLTPALCSWDPVRGKGSPLGPTTQGVKVREMEGLNTGAPFRKRSMTPLLRPSAG